MAEQMSEYMTERMAEHMSEPKSDHMMTVCQHMSECMAVWCESTYVSEAHARVHGRTNVRIRTDTVSTRTSEHIEVR